MSQSRVNTESFDLSKGPFELPLEEIPSALRVIWGNHTAPLRSSYGPIPEGEEYAIPFEMLATTSTHNFTLSNVITDLILASDNNKGTYLEIGAGVGILAANTKRFFQNMTLVEPNALFAQLLRTSPSLRSSPDHSIQVVEKDLNGYLESHSEGKHSFIVASHMFYYLENWKLQIERLFNKLDPGGSLVIAVYAKTDELTELNSEFNGIAVQDPPLREAVEEFTTENSALCASTFITTEDYSCFPIGDLKTIREVIGFYLYGGVASPDQIDEFVARQIEAKRYKTIETESGTFLEFPASQQIAIIIRKN